MISLSFSLENSVVSGMRFKDVTQEELGPRSTGEPSQGLQMVQGQPAFQRTSVDSQTTKMWNKTLARNTGQGSLEGYSYGHLCNQAKLTCHQQCKHAFFTRASFIPIT